MNARPDEREILLQSAGDRVAADLAASHSMTFDQAAARLVYTIDADLEGFRRRREVKPAQTAAFMQRMAILMHIPFRIAGIPGVPAKAAHRRRFGRG